MDYLDVFQLVEGRRRLTEFQPGPWDIGASFSQTMLERWANGVDGAGAHLQPTSKYGYQMLLCLRTNRPYLSRCNFHGCEDHCNSDAEQSWNLRSVEHGSSEAMCSACDQRRIHSTNVLEVIGAAAEWIEHGRPQVSACPVRPDPAPCGQQLVAWK